VIYSEKICGLESAETCLSCLHNSQVAGRSERKRKAISRRVPGLVRIFQIYDRNRFLMSSPGAGCYQNKQKY